MMPVICTILINKCNAQTAGVAVAHNISLFEYLKLVGSQNFSYIAEQYNIGIAEAGIESARVFPDPQFSMDVYDNQEASLHLGRGFTLGLGTNLELGGKRRARINLAMSEVELSRAMLQDYFRNLRADASLAYFNALLLYYQHQALSHSASAMQQLAEADSVRLLFGTITAIDARQSRLEARTILNGVYQAEADWRGALLQLNLYAGSKSADSILSPVGDFEHLSRQFSLIQLIEEAQSNRADLVAAKQNKVVADRNLNLIKANRKMDLGVNAGYQFAGESTNETAPTPAYSSVSVGISVPLKWSNRYKGDLKAARYSIKQSEILCEQVLLQIQVEVTKAYTNYLAAGKQVAAFHNGLIAESEKILEGKIYSYKRGETSLLEVLNARRTYNDILQSYYQAQYQYAASLIELERSAGIWDINR